ncbi:MAG TPA: hypothetical protein PLV88_06280, partial [Methanoregulaceae archaeon]|nr:hypothetical protein [Methanoregulaceae archaeon]
MGTAKKWHKNDVRIFSLYLITSKNSSGVISFLTMVELSCHDDAILTTSKISFLERDPPESHFVIKISCSIILWCHREI